MMYCTACGEQLHEKAIMCPKCGVATANYEKKTPLTRSQIIWFYVAAVLMPAIGFWLGIYALVRAQFGHGVALIIISAITWEFWFTLISELG